MCSVICGRTNFSSVLKEVVRSDIDLQEVGCVDGLLGYRMETTLTSFHNVGILCVIEKFNISVRALIVCVRKCSWCKFEMTARPVEDMCFDFFVH